MTQSTDLKTALAEHFGFDEFLEAQDDVITRILAGGDLCVVMPTGAGKSLCYQLPILMRDGYGLVVSPLISLMKDQVDALVARNIPAAYINSTVPPREQHDILWKTAQGQVRILYVAPERFRIPAFRNLIEECPPTMVVVDEAHCISQWGHDFRPDYMKLGPAISELRIPQVCAFTATATPLVRDDICQNLHRPDMDVYVAGFQRPNLSFSVVNCQSNADKLSVLHELLADPKPTIVYTSTRKAVDEIAPTLDCIGYHAGMSDEDRTIAQDRFMSEDCPVLVATNAFGMGIDRADVRRVVHYNIPGSLEAYYQEAGRAGRDGEPADCVLLYAYHDRFVQEFLINLSNPPDELLRDLYDVLLREFRTQRVDELELRMTDLATAVPSAKSESQVGAALRIIERHGYVERGYRRDNRGFLRFTGNLADLKLIHQHESTQRSLFIHRCIRQLGDDLTEGIPLTYEALSMVTGLRHDQILRVVRALQGDVLQWSPPFSGRSIRLLRPEETQLDIDFTELHKKRDFDFSRLEGVIEYTRTTDCRQRFLVSYFGQQVDGWRCECCDLCKQLDHSLHRDPTEDEQMVIEAVLQTVWDFGGRFGRGRVAQVLAGAKNQDIIRWRLDRHPRHGTLSHLGQSHVMRYIDTLRKAGCVEISGSDPKYPCVDITQLGIDVLHGNRTIKVDFPESAERAPGKPRRSRRTADHPAVDEDVLAGFATKSDDSLYERLRDLRNDMASERGLPPYQVLSNAALRGLADMRPVTPEEAQKVKGIGRIKARTIVPVFLDEISKWREDML